MQIVDSSLTDDIALNNATILAMNDFERNAKLGIQLMLKFKELAIEEGLTPDDRISKTYFITIRPKDDAIIFNDFQQRIIKFLQRKCFRKYTYSYEQKGTTLDTLGEGFHVHIVASMTSRSKGEVLRNTISTFKDICAANCIQVDICKNPEKLINNYLINYESDDGHKITTKDFDAQWRYENNLQPLYIGGPDQVQSGPSIMEIVGPSGAGAS